MRHSYYYIQISGGNTKTKTFELQAGKDVYFLDGVHWIEHNRGNLSTVHDFTSYADAGYALQALFALGFRGVSGKIVRVDPVYDPVYPWETSETVMTEFDIH